MTWLSIIIAGIITYMCRFLMVTFIKNEMLNENLILLRSNMEMLVLFNKELKDEKVQLNLRVDKLLNVIEENNIIISESLKKSSKQDIKTIIINNFGDNPNLQDMKRELNVNEINSLLYHNDMHIIHQKIMGLLFLLSKSLNSKRLFSSMVKNGFILFPFVRVFVNFSPPNLTYKIYGFFQDSTSSNCESL